jgi:simple sugar transport system permease protein
MRLEKRDKASAAALVLAPLAAVAATLVVCALLVAWAGAPIGRTYAAIAVGGFGSLFAWSETLTRAVPLILTGLAATVAFRARLFNIGAEGQLYGGAMAAVMTGSALLGEGDVLRLPAWVALLLVFAAAALVGALLLLGPAWLKARLGVDEVVTTLLLNFIILLGVSALLDGPMKDATAMGWPQSVPMPAELELARPFQGLRLHSGLFIAMLLAVLLALVFRYTVLGFAIRASGANARAAAFAGVPALRTTLLVAAMSGALAGLAGAIEVAGRAGYVTLDMSPGYGYTGIVIAMLAALQPLAVLAASIWVAGVLVGSDSMSRVVGVPTYIADVVVATSLIAVLVATMLAQYRVRWRTAPPRGASSLS